MFSEVTEVRDGVAQLTSRAATEDVAREIIREMDWYDRYLQRGRVDRSANTTPGNKKGGLSNIVEKAMADREVGQRADRRRRASRRSREAGLLYAATPASDFICGTLQLAAGMNLHIFTTGRGTPYGLAQVPVIKVATRSDLAPLARPDGSRRGQIDRRGHDRGHRLGTVPADARCRERQAPHVGRAVEARECADAVQPGAGDLTRAAVAAGARGRPFSLRWSTCRLDVHDEEN